MSSAATETTRLFAAAAVFAPRQAHGPPSRATPPARPAAFPTNCLRVIIGVSSAPSRYFFAGFSRRSWKS